MNNESQPARRSRRGVSADVAAETPSNTAVASPPDTGGLDPLQQMLAAMTSVLRPGGRIVLVMGDADIRGERVNAASQLARLAPHAPG